MSAQAFELLCCLICFFQRSSMERLWAADGCFRQAFIQVLGGDGASSLGHSHLGHPGELFERPELALVAPEDGQDAHMVRLQRQEPALGHLLLAQLLRLLA